MSERRPLSILVFPSDDRALLRLVEQLVRDSALRDTNQLETRLRPLYPRLSARSREIAGEAFDTWYVYRDGSFAPRRHGDAWWERADAACVDYDLSGQVLDATPAYAALMAAGDTKALKGRAFTDFVTPEAKAPAEMLFGLIVGGEPAQSVVQFVSASGERLDIEHRTWRTTSGVRSAIRPATSGRPEG